MALGYLLTLLVVTNVLVVLLPELLIDGLLQGLAGSKVSDISILTLAR